MAEDYTGRFKFDDRIRSGVKSALSNLAEPEGLATGALGAFVFGGPIGLALGITQGILAKRMRQTELEEAAAEREMLAGVDTLFQESLNAAGTKQGITQTDKDQLAELERQYKIQRKLTMSPNEQTRQGAIRSLGEMGTHMNAWLEDVETKHEEIQTRQIGELDAVMTNARETFDTGLKDSQALAERGEQIHGILTSGEDINSGPVRAQLANLLGVSVKEMLADPEDWNDALVAMSGLGGPITQAIAAYVKGKGDVSQFTFTKEQWRTLAYTMQTAGVRKQEQLTQNARRIGSMLDRASEGINYKPALSYTDRILTGETQDAPKVSGQEGAYGAETAAAPQQQPDSVRVQASKAVETAKEKIKGALTSPWIDPTGFISQGIFGQPIPEDDPRVTSGFLQPRHGRERRARPTN